MKTVHFKNPKYVGDPINAVRIFNEKEVDELVLLDIGATPAGRSPNLKEIAHVAGECFMPLAYGGGIRDLEQIKLILNLGVEKVILNSAACANPDLIAQAAREVGSQSVVVSIDVKKTLLGKYRVHTHSGRRSTGLDPVDFARLMETKGAGELIIHSIDRDGTLQGYDLELVQRVAQAVNVPVVACGGAGRLEHLAAAVKAGAAAVAAGSLFVFYGKHRAVLINYPSPEELRKTFNGESFR